MRLNIKNQPTVFTHEGAPAKNITDYAMLRRSVLSCFLWEGEFYEDGVTIADRISEYARKVPVEQVAALALEARTKFNLRHVPLLLLAALVERRWHRTADTIAEVIQRPDEMCELLAIYWRDGKKPIANQLKLGLAKAFLKFDEYQLAKHDRNAAIRIRDVMFLSHPRPRDMEQAGLFHRVANNNMAVPDTWEVALSAGADKKETFERLITEGKLGYMALLRNLRNMVNANVDLELVAAAIEARRGANRILPFRYIAAARACPRLEKPIDNALKRSVLDGKPLPGKTAVMVDVSGSMHCRLSARSDLTRMDAAAALASVIDGDIRVFTFSSDVVEIPHRIGMAGVDAVINSQGHGMTYLGKAMAHVNTVASDVDRLIVITDEQTYDRVPDPYDRVPDPVAKRAYMINVASARNGIGYGRWIHLDGFSESVIRFIHEYEGDSVE